MDSDEMLRLWRGQLGLDGPSPEEVVMGVKERARKFDRTLFWRDVREVVAGLLAAAVMLGVSLQAPGWSPKVGALAGIVLLAGVLAKLLGARRKVPRISQSMPLAERLRAEIAKVEGQIELLSSVRSWYVWPLAVGATLWLVSMVPATGAPPKAAAALLVVMTAISALIFTAVGYGVVKLNNLAVTRHLEPYRRDLEEVLGQLEAGS